GDDIRHLHRRPFQQRPAQLPGCGRFSGRGAAGARALLGAAEPCAIRREGERGSRPARAGRLSGGDDRIRRSLHRHAARGLGVHLLAARFQITVTVRPAAATAGIVALAALLLAAAAELQLVRERRYPPPSDEVEESLYVRSGTAARRLAGAYSSLGADLYWIRAIQHYGATKLRLAAAQRVGPEPPPLIAAPTD